MPRRAFGVGGVVATALLLTALTPRSSAAAGCDEWLRQPRSFIGTYVPSNQPYARAFVFTMLVTCEGKTEIVTVQSVTGGLPMCGLGQDVELKGTLIWNKALADAHYEINDPTGVTCSGTAVAATKPSDRRDAPAPAAPEPGPPEAPAPEPRAPASEPSAPSPEPRVAAPVPASSGVWAGRYQDSRGTGDVTFTLVRGSSTVSGTWKMRTGGGGPMTGLIEPSGTRIQIRMENLAADCPGTFEGAGEVTGTALAVTYRGTDCEGAVSDGRLELRLLGPSR